MKRVKMPTDSKTRKMLLRDPIVRRMCCGGRWRFAEGAAMMLDRDEVSDKRRVSFVVWVLRDTARRFPERGTTREARAVGRLLRAVRRVLLPVVLAARGRK